MGEAVMRKKGTIRKLCCILLAALLLPVISMAAEDPFYA